MEPAIIRQMQVRDLDFAAGCTAAEGWASETRTEFESLLAYDPGGCLVAEADGARAAICVATSYGQLGFVGELIVEARWRGQGLGRRLLEQAVQYLQSRGARSVLLDGVVAAVPLYEKVGFRKVCRSLRFGGGVEGRRQAGVRAMRAEDLPAVCGIDRQAFGAERAFFLRRRQALYPELCHVLEEGGKIAGFITGRRGHGMISAGPWVVCADAERAGDLLAGLAAEAEGVTLGLGILETNARAVAVVRALGLVERPEPPWRMVLGADVGFSGQMYAIGSAAKG